MLKKHPFLTSILFLFCISAFADAAMGPLRVSIANPRYFEDGSGNVVYLTGWNTAFELQDSPYDDLDGRPTTPDYYEYLGYLTSHNHNYMRMWMYMQTRWRQVDTINTDPMPFERVNGYGNANDGSPKFDLYRLNQSYFDRLRQRVIAAREQGIYVSVMLFQGWSTEYRGQGEVWQHNPFNASNNINGIHGDLNGNGQGEETETLGNPEITAIQEAYVRKVIDTVNDLDNVMYEITNEGETYTIEWQKHMAGVIRNYEDGKPKQHLVGITGGYLSNSVMNSSSADWIAPSADEFGSASDIWVIDPPEADGNKVSIMDSDHTIGAVLLRTDPTVGVKWVWKGFTRGHNTSLLVAPPSWIGGPLQSAVNTDNPLYDTIRRTMGYTKTYADIMDLAQMTPSGNLTSTTFALANPGSEYLIFAPDGGSFTVDLPAGTYAFEWFDPTEGFVVQTGSITSSGGNQSFFTPFSGDAVLYLSSGKTGWNPGASSVLPRRLGSGAKKADNELEMALPKKAVRQNKRSINRRERRERRSAQPGLCCH